MANFYQNNNEPLNWGAALGGGIGSGLAHMTNKLAEHNLEQMINKKKLAEKANALQSMGLSPELASLPDTVLAQMIKQKQQQENLQNLTALIGGSGSSLPGTGGIPAPQAQQGTPFEQPGLFAGAQNIRASRPSMGQPGGNAGGASNLNVNDPNVIAAFAGYGQTGMDILKNIQNQQHQEQNLDFKRREEQFAQQKYEEESAFKNRQEQRKEYEKIVDYNKPFNTDLNAGVKTARTGLKVIDELDKLINTGKVEFGAFAGIWPASSQSKETQRFTKEIAKLKLIAAEEAGGGRLTNLARQTINDSIPALTNSPEGAREVLDSLRKSFDESLAYDEARKESLKAHGGKEFYGLESEVNDRVVPKLERLQQRTQRALEDENVLGQPDNQPLPEQVARQEQIQQSTANGQPNLPPALQEALQPPPAPQQSPQVAQPANAPGSPIAGIQSALGFTPNAPGQTGLPGNETFGQSVGRTLGQIGQNVAAGALGTAGNLISLGFAGANKLTGGKTGTYEEFAKNKLGGYQPFPTTNEILRQTSDWGPEKEYFKPKTKLEARINSLAEDFGSLAVGGAIGKAGKIATAINALPIVNDAFKLGIPEKYVQYAKIGTLAAITLKDIGSMNKSADNMIAESKKLGEDSIVPLGRELEHSLSDMWEALGKSKNSPQIRDLKNNIETVVNATREGRIGAPKAVELYEDLNRMVKHGRINPGTRELVNESMGILRKTIAKSVDKDFVNTFERGAALSKGLNEGGKIRQQINKFIPEIVRERLNPKTLSVLGLTSAGGASKLGYLGFGTAGKAGIGLALANAADMIVTQPAVRNHVGRIFKEAAKENPQNMIKLVLSLDKQIRG